MCLFSRIGSHCRVVRPSTRTWPAVGNSIPLVILSAVVLPDPLRPSSTRVSPASTEKLTPDNTTRPAISYDTFRNSTSGIFYKRFRIESGSISTMLAERLTEGGKQTDSLFEILKPEAIYERPVAERHRLIFYLGHLEAFDGNLMRGGPESESDNLFAFGID